VPFGQSEWGDKQELDVNVLGSKLATGYPFWMRVVFFISDVVVIRLA